MNVNRSLPKSRGPDQGPWNMMTTALVTNAKATMPQTALLRRMGRCSVSVVASTSIAAMVDVPPAITSRTKKRLPKNCPPLHLLEEVGHRNEEQITGARTPSQSGLPREDGSLSSARDVESGRELNKGVNTESLADLAYRRSVLSLRHQ